LIRNYSTTEWIATTELHTEGFTSR
jgi:hypothetical protein